MKPGRPNQQFLALRGDRLLGRSFPLTSSPAGKVAAPEVITPASGAAAPVLMGVDLAAGDDVTVISFVVTPQLMVLINAVATHDDLSVADALISACAHRAKAIGCGALARAVLDEQERRVGHGRHNGAHVARRHENSRRENSHGSSAIALITGELTDVPEFARPNTSRFPTGDR